MNGKKIGYVLLTISLVMIISGGVSSFLIGLNEDRELTFRRMDDVSSKFEDFSTMTTLFEDKREILYSSVIGNTYYDSMLLNDTSSKASLKDYELMVDEISRLVSSLDKLCDDVYYPDGDVNNKCINYKGIYEQVVNYFVGDIKAYNNNVLKFNQYQASLQSNAKILEYETTKDYIDYNKDKQFDGKEE